MYNRESNWQDLVESAWEYSKALDNLTEETECPMLDYCRSLGNIKAREAFFIMAQHDGSGPWFLWCVTKGWHLLDYHLRKDLMRIVCDSMPVVASIMYLKNDDLEPEDYADLWLSFSDEMPLMRRRIIEGRGAIKTAAPGGN